MTAPLPTVHSPITPKLVEGLYFEAMTLADAARDYFDREGAGEREGLDAVSRVAFSCESLKITTRLMHALDAAGVDAPVALGGVVPEGDRPALRSAGVAAIFDASSTTADVVHAVVRLIDARS